MRPLRRMVISGATLLLVAGTWPVVCWWITGSPLPDSGVAKALHAERLSEIQRIDPEFLQNWNFLTVATQGPRYLLTTGGRVSRLSLILVPLLLAVFVIVSRSRDRRWSVFPRTMRLAVGLWPIIAASGCLLFVYPLVLRSMRSWYVIGPLLVMTLLVASFVIDLASHLPNRRVLAVTVAVTVWLVVCNIEAVLFPRNLQASAVIAAGELVQKYAGPGTRVGAFNAGVLAAWAAPGTTVINLDGVVNHSAVVALRDRELAGYVERSEIQFIIDIESSLTFFDAIGGAGLCRQLQRLETIPCGQRYQLGVWQVHPNREGSSRRPLSSLPVP